MHSDAEAELLARHATGARHVVEIGVYEGSSARVLCAALDRDAELHLIDPFVDSTGMSMVPGWHGTPFATRMAIRRFAADGGPRVRWHIARSQDVGRAWTGPALDLVFVDGDHGEPGVREDWELWHPHVRRGGTLAFHDARLSQPGGRGGPGPTAVVDELRAARPEGWEIVDEADSLVVLRRSPERDSSPTFTR